MSSKVNWTQFFKSRRDGSPYKHRRLGLFYPSQSASNHPAAHPAAFHKPPPCGQRSLVGRSAPRFPPFAPAKQTVVHVDLYLVRALMYSSFPQSKTDARTRHAISLGKRVKLNAHLHSARIRQKAGTAHTVRSVHCRRCRELPKISYVFSSKLYEVFGKTPAAPPLWWDCWGMRRSWLWPFFATASGISPEVDHISVFPGAGAHKKFCACHLRPCGKKQDNTGPGR